MEMRSVSVRCSHDLNGNGQTRRVRGAANPSTRPDSGVASGGTANDLVQADGHKKPVWIGGFSIEESSDFQHWREQIQIGSPDSISHQDRNGDLGGNTPRLRQNEVLKGGEGK
jgi:hypothetical protein